MKIWLTVNKYDLSVYKIHWKKHTDMVQKMLTEHGMGRVKRISFSIFKVCNEKSTSFSFLKYIKLLKKKSRMRPHRDLNFLNSHTDAGARKEEVRQHLYSHSFNSLQIASYQITFAFPSKQCIYSYIHIYIYMNILSQIKRKWLFYNTATTW